MSVLNDTDRRFYQQLEVKRAIKLVALDGVKTEVQELQSEIAVIERLITDETLSLEK